MNSATDRSQDPDSRAWWAAVIGAICTAVVIAGLWRWSNAATAELGVVLYVATTGSDVGNDCRNPSLPCRHIQHAVDQAPIESEVRVAAGTYTGTGSLWVPIVQINKDVAVRGGYSPGNWTVRDANIYQTTLDGQATQPGASIGSKTGWPEISGFHITGGPPNAAGGAVRVTGRGIVSGNVVFRNGFAVGGAPGIDGSTILASGDGNVIQFNRVFSNAGSGIRLEDTTETDIRENEVTGNVAQKGGGIAHYLGYARVIGNRVVGNTATVEGGGVHAAGFFGSQLTANQVISNSAPEGGGAWIVGVVLSEIADNVIVGNVASGAAGGMSIGFGNSAAPPRVSRNLITRNTAPTAGGLRIGSGPFVFESNVIAANQALTAAGVLVNSTAYEPIELFNTTISNNQGDGIGLLLVDGHLLLTDTIVAGHSVEISGTSLRGWRVNGVLWSGNGQNLQVSTPPIEPVSGEVTGDSAFAADGYHLTGGSAARDRGQRRTEATDIDGQPRTGADLPDLGADEFAPTVPIPSPTPWIAAPQPTPTPPADPMFQIKNGDFESSGGWTTFNGEPLNRMQPGSASLFAGFIGFRPTGPPTQRIVQPIYLPSDVRLVEVEIDVRPTANTDYGLAVRLVEPRSLSSIDILRFGGAPANQWTTAYAVTDVVTFAGKTVLFEISSGQYASFLIDNVWARVVCSMAPTPGPQVTATANPAGVAPTPTAPTLPRPPTATLVVPGVLPPQLEVPDQAPDQTELLRVPRMRLGGPRMPRVSTCY